MNRPLRSSVRSWSSWLRYFQDRARGARFRRGPPKQPQPRLQWTSDNEFSLDGISYVCSGLPKQRSTAERFSIIKARWSVERYERLLRELAPETILELGIFDGGSTAFIAQFARPRKLVALDLTPKPCQVLEAFLDQHDLRPSVATHYGVNQADERALKDIVDRHFGGVELDLVIDDASHLVHETRQSFELLFPRLRAGGLYLIEDWSWAHNIIPPQGSRRNLTPLSVLVFELMVAGAHRPTVIEELVITKGWALVRRGPEELPSDGFRLAETYGEVAVGLMRNLSRPWADD